MADILEQIAARVGNRQRPVSPQAIAIAEAMMRRQGGPTMPMDPQTDMLTGGDGAGFPHDPVGGAPMDMVSPGMMPATPRTEGMADPIILDRVERDMARQGDFYGTDGYYAQRSANAMQEHGPGFYDYPSERATRAIGAGTDAQPTQDYYNSLTPGMRQQFMNMKVDDPMGQSPSPDQMRERFPPGYEPLDRNKMRDALRGNYDDARRFDDARSVDTAQVAGVGSDVPFSYGVMDPEGTTPMNRLQDEEANARSAMTRLRNIDNLLQENPDLLDGLTWQGDMRRRLLALRDKTGFDALALNEDQTEYLTDVTQFRQNVLRNINRTIKEVTGAQMGEAEAKRIRAEMPDVDASPIEFRTKLAAAMDMIRMDAVRFKIWRENGGKGEPNQITDNEAREVLASRGRDLYRQAISSGLPPDEARLAASRALSEEFGL